MRRPLSDAGLIFILILLILKLIIPDVPVDLSGIESHTVSVSGRLVRKEVKIKDGEETLIWYIQTPNQILLKDYQVTRIMTFINPSKYSSSSAYQQDNSVMAIGSGQLYGKGLSNNKMLPTAEKQCSFQCTLCRTAKYSGFFFFNHKRRGLSRTYSIIF